MQLTSFDIAFFSAALINLTSAVMLVGIAPATPMRKALWVYAAGLGLMGVSLLTVALRTWLGISGQDWLITNTTSVLSAACLIVAVHYIFERAPPFKAIATALAILVVLLTIFDGDVDKRPLRSLITVGALMVSMFWRASLALRFHPRDERAPAVAMALLLSTNGSVMLVAIVWSFLGDTNNPAVGFAAMTGATISVPVIVTVLMIVNRRAQAKLRMLADTDTLTGALNRRAFFEQAEQRLEGAVLAMIDFDNFKHINDQHGHLAGDQVLAAGIGALRSRIEPGSLLGRYGGEEFILLLPPQVDPAKRIEPLRLGINTAASTALGRPVTASIGFARHRAGEHIDATIGRADRALYDAKALGRNRSVAAA